MGFNDRPADFSDHPGDGRFRAAARRVFGDGENPLNWAVPVYTAWGIRVRAHLFFVVYILVELAWSFAGNEIGPLYTAISLAVLFSLVLLHEYGHCFMCRRVGGEADDILMWPLGGLASCMPPDTWRANFWTTLAGPAVNFFLAIPAGVALLALTSPEAVIFNPFKPGAALSWATLAEGAQPLWLVALWWFYFINLLLLAFNMLVPMYPMDAGRLLHAVLRARTDKRRATEIVVVVGFVAAGVLVVLGMVSSQPILMGIGLFGGVSCWLERRALRYADDLGFDPALSAPEGPSAAERRAEKAEAKRAQQEADQQARIDAILQKISESGMDSLTRAERKTLEQASAARSDRSDR